MIYSDLGFGVIERSREGVRRRCEFGGEIMSRVLELVGTGVINLRGEGGRLFCWFSICVVYFECFFNRFRGLCKFGGVGVLMGL